MASGSTFVNCIEVAAAAPGSVYPGASVGVGGKVIDVLPAAGTTGQLIPIGVDEYGQMILKGYSRSRGSLLITPIDPIPRATFLNAFSALSAAGSTPATDISEYPHITWQIVIAAIDTSVDVRIEGTDDGTTWFNMDDSGADTQYLANGPYSLRADSRAVLETRLTMTAEAGGANVTVTGTLFAGN